MKRFFWLYFLLLFIFLWGCATDYSYNKSNTDNEVTSQKHVSQYTNYVIIKYRDDPVDIANFETFNTSKSSFIRGAWYDKQNQYMIIDLNGIKYHYCMFPNSVWNSLKQASSLGIYYNTYIKENYDCRLWWVPIY